MNVLHISTAKSWRGGEQQIAYLIGELANNGVGGHVFCVQGAAMEAFCRANTIPFTTYRKRSSFDLAGALQVRKLCRSGEFGTFDLIHAHDSHAHTLLVLAASIWGNRVPAVVSRRVDFPVRGRFSRWKYNHPTVKRIVCVSGFIKDVMTPAVNDPARLVVVHSGVDIGKFPEKPEGRLRKEFGLREDRPIIANVAAIAPHKDYPTFVDVVEGLVQDGLDAQFMIVGGDGGEEQMIRERIRAKELDQNIILTGFRDDIPTILPEIDLLLFTSKTEGLGTTLLDAFAAGVPVVATAAGGIPELVINEQTGLLANVGNVPDLAAHVKRLIADNALREALRANAKTFVQEFSKHRTAEKTMKVYGEVKSLKLEV